MIEINDKVSIDENELQFEYARSSGPGGQNVNKVETKVTLRWDVQATGHLDADQKARVFERLATRITKFGVLRVTSQRHRTRGANQKAATDRFVELLADALETQSSRVKTKTPKAAKRRRLESKRRRSEVKRRRSQRDFDE